MYEIYLDDAQSSVVTASSGPVQVCDGAGQVLGKFVPNGQPVPNGESNSGRGGRLDHDHWVQCWNEWYFSTADEE